MALDYQLLEIKGSLLQSSYAVYIVEIKHVEEQKSFFYVGQTGDSNHISARSPFYRLSAHLSYLNSTQNQIYKNLKEVLKITGENNRLQMEQWLNACTIRMHYFKTDDFEFLNNTIATNLDLHHKKRRLTLSIESALIAHLKEKGVLLNRSKNAGKKLVLLEEPAQNVFNDIKAQLDECIK